ncbi:hypothetical protein ACF059_10630 [Streptomyces sp. NPDC016562]|uniref:hypothetical protein n=1 Tax=Streptomyces sp. NPDC016562 TaxID=3364966 RepID=UPI0036FA11EF
MSATNASQRLGFGLVGALLAGGLLLAACAVPDGRPRSGDVLVHHPGVVAGHTELQRATP